MFNNSNIPYSVPVYPAGGGTNNGGLFGGDSWAWIIVLLLIFGWGGNLPCGQQNCLVDCHCRDIKLY